MCELEKTASAKIQKAESQHKSAEARLHIAESQMVEISAKLEREYDRSNELQSEINKHKAEFAETRTGAQNAENAA